MTATDTIFWIVSLIVVGGYCFALGAAIRDEEIKQWKRKMRSAALRGETK